MLIDSPDSKAIIEIFLQDSRISFPSRNSSQQGFFVYNWAIYIIYKRAQQKSPQNGDFSLGISQVVALIQLKDL